MNIIPAIDIKDGKVVRLCQGLYDELKCYFNNPVDIAEKWIESGARMLHIVDLDGAREGYPKNKDIIKEIISIKKNTFIEVGGGIRTSDAIEYILNIGADRVVLGTKALDKLFLEKVLSKFSERIIVSVDSKEGFVAKEGWQTKDSIGDVKFIELLKEIGLKEVIFTDISKDGMMAGPNIKKIKSILEKTKIKLIASGGVASMEDIKELKNLSSLGLSGVIIGKALYEGTINIKDAILIADQQKADNSV